MNLMKKNYIAFILAMSISMLCADENLTYGNNDTLSFAPQDNTCQPSCCEESKGKFFIRGDLLYWKPHASGLELDFGTTYISQSSIDDLEIVVTDEIDADPHFKWNAGYRIAAGYGFGCSPFEVAAFWTHFQGKGSRKSRQDISTLNTGNYHVKLDQFDVIVAYNSSFAPCFTIKPFIGIRGTKIHQNVNAFLVTDITLLPTGSATETRNLDDSHCFKGIGPVFGFNVDYTMKHGFGVYGTAAGSVLYGKDKIHFNDSDIFSAPLSQEIFSTNRRNLHSFNCNIDLALGLSWQTCITDTFLVNLKVGFEHHQYFGMRDFGANRGDLCFDGAIVSINIAL